MQPIDLDENFIPLCHQVQGKHDYSEILKISDTDRDVQYVMISVSLICLNKSSMKPLFLTGVELASVQDIG